jgi:predicted anti-sigma-YlaC factor YlaD
LVTPAGDPERGRRQRLIRRASLYAAAFMAAAVGVAMLGAALIAWLLTVRGLPFLQTWVILTVVALAVPLLGAAVKWWRERRGGAGR